MHMSKAIKQRLKKATSVFFAIALVIGLLPTAGLINPVPAYAAGETVTATVDGLGIQLPTLVEGVDFTAGKAINADPINYTDAAGNMPLAELVAQKESQGYELVWYDADTNKKFDWNKTAITKNTNVIGKWEQMICEVTVSLNNDTSKSTVTKVLWGSSYINAAGSAPETPTRNGWNFLGWYDAAGNAFDFNAAVKSSTTVEAKWSVADVNIVPVTDPTSDIPGTVDGSCWIGDTWGKHPASFNVSNFSGFLSGASGTGKCALRSAAQPTNVTADYHATLKSTNMETGDVIYDVLITPPDVAHEGGPRNKYGLIGYQTVSFEAHLVKNLGGWIEIQKSSSNTDITDGNDCYSLEGAEYVAYDANGAARAKLTTDANGYAKSDLVPTGNYTLKEVKAPKGYSLDETPISVTVNGGRTAHADVSDKPQNDPVNVWLGKYDGEKTYNMEKNLPNGSASLAGAEYVVQYYDGYYEKQSDAEKSGDPVRTWVMTTDEDGYSDLQDADTYIVAQTSDGKYKSDPIYRSSAGNPTFPLGTYVITEYKAPEGYNLPQPFGMDQTYVRQVTTVGSAESVFSWNTPQQAEPVQRSDVEFTKAASDDGHSLANVPFKITSKTTHESHIVVTDSNGKVSTKSSWNKHTDNTNGNDWFLESEETGIQAALDGVVGFFSGNSGKELDPKAGTWFTGLQEGEDQSSAADPDNDRGALPYDTYTLEELPCDANDGYQLIKKDFTIDRDNTFNADNTINLGTLIDQDPSITTKASDKEDGDQKIVAEPDVTVVDQCSIDNLQVGTSYAVNGTLMDKATKKAYVDAEGNEVKATKTFTAKSQNQDVYLEFNFDASNVTEDTDLVVFEELATSDAPGRIIADEKDFSNIGQTVTVSNPQIGTMASDGISGGKTAVKDTEMVVKDTVSFSGLSIGRSYTLKASLMDKATNTALKDATGNYVTATKTFTPTASNGLVEVEFRFDGSNLADGQQIVAFESLTCKDKEIASHVDIDDPLQLVTVSEPTIHTLASSKQEGHVGKPTVVRDTEAVLNDSVEMAGLVKGKDYTLVGKIMDKSTNKPYIDPSTGKEITATKDFTADDAKMSVGLEFTFDASKLDKGTQLVVFETLQRHGEDITKHEDINDEEQTVIVVPPTIGTVATDGLDNDKLVIADRTATVVDEVAFEGLVVGKEYVAHGVLMRKDTNEPLLDADGNQITGSTTFTPDSPNGSVQVTFTFDSALLAGKKLVAFEKLTRNGIEIVSHEDIDDEDQSVEVVPTEVGTTAYDSADGDKHMAADTESSLTDEVAYKNVVPNEEVTIAGILMDKGTSLPLLSGEGASSISTEDLTAFWEELQADMGIKAGTSPIITVDGAAFGKGFDVTVADGSYSYVSEDGVQHILSKVEDGWKLNDVNGETATEVGTYTDEQVSVSENVVKLPIAPDYEAITKLFQEHADIVDCLSIQTMTFTPEKTDGTATLEFPINSIYNEDTDTVAFEFLFKNSEIIAMENDLGNEDQTVSIVTPKIGTTATDTTDGDHTLLPSREASITDSVEYSDLIPSKSYTLSGVIYDKSTGEPLQVGGGQVTAEKDFVPNQADGTVDLEFTFDASEAGGKDLVVFETVYKDGVEIAKHQDINDEGQTVSVSPVDDNTSENPEGDGYSKTGVDMAWVYGLIALLVALAGGAGAYGIRHRKLAKASEGETGNGSDEE